MTLLSTRGGWRPSFNLTDYEIDQMRLLWEGAPELSASSIAAMFGVTKNTVIGRGWRRRWKVRREAIKEPLTLSQRLDALDIFPPARRCVFPIGHPRTEGFRFCAGPVTEVGEPYCAEHNTMCWSGTASAVQRAAWEASDPERRLKAAARLRALNGGKATKGAAA